MHKITTLIENIRTALAHSESVPPNKLELYARDYANECNVLNDRLLNECLPPLRSGNVSEALRLAEASPSIFESFGLLDFEGRQEWLDVCDALGYEMPMPFTDGAFQELNDAYVKIAPLDPLLKRHRLLALNGSSIRERLNVLRSIAKLDTTNVHWQTDQEMFEKVRLKELEREADDALGKDDTPQINALYSELVQSWIIAPPSEYRLKICNAVLKMQADKLVHYFMVLDYNAAYSIEQTILQILSENQIAMPVKIGGYIQPAIEWLRATENNQYLFEQFQWEIQQLRQALMVNSSREMLKSLYAAMCDTARLINRTIPPDLKEQYRDQMEEKARFEMYLWLVVGAILAFIVLIVVMGIISTANRSQPTAAELSPTKANEIVAFYSLSTPSYKRKQLLFFGQGQFVVSAWT